MDLQTLTMFFKWCTIVDAGIFLFWMLWLVAAPDLVYRIQNRLFPISRPAYDVLIYAFIAAFKIFFVVFNLAPYVALLILAEQ